MNSRICVLVAAELLVGVGPGGEVVPARAARGLRVRGDHLDAVARPGRPSPRCPSGCPRAPGTRSSRCRARSCAAACACQSAGILPDFAAMASMSLASASVTTCASSPSITARAWAARAAVRGLDVERRVALGLPVRVEGGVELAVELAGRVVGDVEQRRLRRGAAGERRPPSRPRPARRRAGSRRSRAGEPASRARQAGSPSSRPQSPACSVPNMSKCRAAAAAARRRVACASRRVGASSRQVVVHLDPPGSVSR